MKKSRLPATDSIQKLAEFWDTHDLTDFDDELDEVVEPVFQRDASIKLHLAPPEAKAVTRMAQGKGISREELIRKWILQKLTKPTKRPARPRSGRNGGARSKAKL